MHYSDAFDCPRHCAVAEVGGRHLDLGESCLVGPINGEGRYLKDWPELCYRYQRARAEAAEKRAMAEHSRAEAAESELAEAKEGRDMRKPLELVCGHNAVYQELVPDRSRAVHQRWR